MWLQFVIKAHRRDEWHGFPLAKDSFDVGVKEKVEKIRKEAAERAKDKTIDDKNKTKLSPMNLKPGKR